MGDAKVAAGSGSIHHVAEVETAKRVLIYTNGDKYFAGRNFVVNPRQLRDFDSFLNEVTMTLRPTFGVVRAIRTPRAGHKVPNLTLLENGKSYVAAGGGKFVKIGYDDIASLLKPKDAGHSPREFVSRRKLQVSGRVRKIKLEPLEIMVYANGETMEPARRLLIKPWIDRDWESVLLTVDEKVQLRSGAVRRLIEVNTKQEVKELKELKSHQYYVAVGAEKFKDLEYGQNEASQSPRQLQKRRYPQLPPLKKKSSTNESGSEATDAHTTPDNGLPNSKADGEHKIKDASIDGQQAAAPTAASASGPKDAASPAAQQQEQPPPSKKQAPAAAAAGAAHRRPPPPPPAATKEPAAKEPAAAQGQKTPKEEAGVPLKPLKHKRSGEKREKKESKEAASAAAAAATPAAAHEAKNIDLDKDEGGIYKAKLKDANEVEEVSEDKHTKQEVPVDQRTAEEVAEEERSQAAAVQDVPAKESERRAEPSSPPPPPPESHSGAHRSARRSGRRSAARRVTHIGEPQTKDRTATPPSDGVAPDSREERPGDDDVEAPQEAPAAGLGEDEAATRIQASFRGHQARRTHAAMAAATEAVREDTPPTKYVKEEQAAVIIQAAYRGHSTRAQLRKERTESDEATVAAVAAATDAPLTQPPASEPDSTLNTTAAAGQSAAAAKDDERLN